MALRDTTVLVLDRHCQEETLSSSHVKREEEVTSIGFLLLKLSSYTKTLKFGLKLLYNCVYKKCINYVHKTDTIYQLLQWPTIAHFLPLPAERSTTANTRGTNETFDEQGKEASSAMRPLQKDKMMRQNA